MSRRDDFNSTLRHEQPEHMIIDLGGNPLSSMEGRSMFTLLQFLGYDIPDKIDNLPFGCSRRLDERLLKYFDIDTRSIGTIVKPIKSLAKKISDNEYIDEWGIRRTFTGMYWDIVNYPLKGATAQDLDSYPWPDPDTIDMAIIDQYTQEAKILYEQTDYVICAEHPVYGIFEIGCWMCGFDDFLYKMAVDEEFTFKFFDIILNYQKKLTKTYYGALGKYIHYTSSGDDFATQNSTFMSPRMFQKYIKPYFKERIAYTKQFTPAAFLHHSCGSVYSLIDDLIDCGVDILNPIQPKAKDMQPEKLKEKFGDRIVFHGGIDTQDILPFGTKESIQETVRDTVAVLNSSGGYIFSAAHNIQEDVPPQNLVYMFEAAKKFGRIQ